MLASRAAVSVEAGSNYHRAGLLRKYGPHPEKIHRRLTAKLIGTFKLR
jgi:hypothetical protein